MPPRPRRRRGAWRHTCVVCGKAGWSSRDRLPSRSWRRRNISLKGTIRDAQLEVEVRYEVCSRECDLASTGSVRAGETTPWVGAAVRANEMLLEVLSGIRGQLFRRRGLRVVT